MKAAVDDAGADVERAAELEHRDAHFIGGPAPGAAVDDLAPVVRRTTLAVGLPDLHAGGIDRGRIEVTIELGHLEYRDIAALAETVAAGRDPLRGLHVVGAVDRGFRADAFLRLTGAGVRAGGRGVHAALEHLQAAEAAYRGVPGRARHRFEIAAVLAAQDVRRLGHRRCPGRDIQARLAVGLALKHRHAAKADIARDLTIVAARHPGRLVETHPLVQRRIVAPDFSTPVHVVNVVRAFHGPRPEVGTRIVDLHHREGAARGPHVQPTVEPRHRVRVVVEPVAESAFVGQPEIVLGQTVAGAAAQSVDYGSHDHTSISRKRTMARVNTYAEGYQPL